VASWCDILILIFN